jgi:putative SOS response-associated peptidase YedK
LTVCGRYTLKARRKDVAAAFDLDDALELPPRYNIAPTQFVPVVRLDEARRTRELALVQWGLVPAWAKDPNIGNRLINARSETVAEKPAFRTAFKSRRCLVVADGFYEWGHVNGKSPYYFHLKDGRPFGFAGLWERWEQGGEPLESCTVITTEANGIVGAVHERMPVILRPEDYGRWLDPGEKAEALVGLLAPLPDNWMAAHPVSKLVNNPGNESPRYIERV